MPKRFLFAVLRILQLEVVVLQADETRPQARGRFIPSACYGERIGMVLALWFYYFITEKQSLLTIEKAKLLKAELGDIQVTSDTSVVYVLQRVEK